MERLCPLLARWSALHRRYIVWLATAVVAVLLIRAVSRVWSFEGTAIAAGKEVSAGAIPEQRGFYMRRLEAKEPVVLRGLGQPGEQDLPGSSTARADSSSRLTASSVDFYDDLNGYFGQLRFQLEHAKAPNEGRRLTPEIGLSLNAGGGWGSEPLKRLATAESDRRLRSLVAGLRSLHRPVFLRIGYGCNAQENGYDPARYVAAFRRITNAIHAAGLSDVAIVWEWSPDAELEAQAEGARSGDAPKRWGAFYPGDEYVDWWGMTLYSEPAINSQATAAYLDEANHRGFPVMISEAMPRGHDVSEGNLLVENWFRPFFSLIARSRGVKAFSYLSRDWRMYPQWSTWGDTRIEANPEVLEYVVGQLRAPLFREPSVQALAIP